MPLQCKQEAECINNGNLKMKNIIFVIYLNGLHTS